MSCILVTGAAGFIGSHTVDKLLEAGHSVVGVDDFRTGHRANLLNADQHDCFSFVEADISEEGVLLKIGANARLDAIIHLAALVSVQDSRAKPELNYRLNVFATHLVAESARMNGVKRVVFASSAAIYGNTTDLPIREEAEKRPISPYGGAKLASEAMLISHGSAFGFVVRCQRYFNVFGPRQDPSSPYSGVISVFDRRYRGGKGMTIFGDGRQTRDFISVHDVAKANVLAATREGVTSGGANICTGRATSLLDVAEVFAQHYPAAPGPIFDEARLGDIVDSVGCPDRATEELGFKAERTVQEALAELIGLG
jgi:UDP-glucose 4-epimerase